MTKTGDMNIPETKTNFETSPNLLSNQLVQEIVTILLKV
jgi:hypothetical protein